MKRAHRGLGFASAMRSMGVTTNRAAARWPAPPARRIGGRSPGQRRDPSLSPGIAAVDGHDVHRVTAEVQPSLPNVGAEVYAERDHRAPAN